MYNSNTVDEIIKVAVQEQDFIEEQSTVLANMITSRITEILSEKGDASKILVPLPFLILATAAKLVVLNQLSRAESMDVEQLDEAAQIILMTCMSTLSFKSSE